MTLRTFRARTMADALTAVKKALGRDAVILQTRTYKVGGVFGLGAKPIVEVTASDGINVAPPRRRPVRPVQPPLAVPAQGLSSQVVAFPVVSVTPSASAVAGAYRRAGTTALPPIPASAPEPAPMRPPFGSIEPDEEAPSITLPVRQRKTGPSRLAVQAPLAPQDAQTRSVLEQELAAIKRMVSQVLQSGIGSSPRDCEREGGGSGVLRGVGGVGWMGGMGKVGGASEPLFNHYLKLLEGQVARELSDQVFTAVRDELTAAELADEQIVRQTVLRHLAALIPTAESVTAPGRAPDGRPLTIALIGPTGVGKTTTLAKLAASYRLRHGKRVGLVTCDTYRIAAVEQLRTYANIIGLPLKVALTPAEMAAACESLADMDIILIDTAGRSQHDGGRLEELRTFIDAAAPHETHLVLSTNASEPVLLKAVERFAVAAPNRVIFTKLDEAVNFGVLVNVAQRIDAKLSFVTTGQEVPDHIEPGTPDRLARLVLDGELTP